MANKILLATLFPEDLNLNGDQANLQVLTERIRLRGQECEIREITKLTDLSKYAFIFIGHGSLAAWDQIERVYPTLFADLVNAQKNGSFIFAVASGYVKFAIALGLVDAQRKTKHRSEFVKVDGVVGYFNSDSDLNPLDFSGHGLLTLLHGPLLAKNPNLADDIISKMALADVSIRNEQLDYLDSLAEQSRKTAFEH